MVGEDVTSAGALGDSVGSSLASSFRVVGAVVVGSRVSGVGRVGSSVGDPGRGWAVGTCACRPLMSTEGCSEGMRFPIKKDAAIGFKVGVNDWSLPELKEGCQLGLELRSDDGELLGFDEGSIDGISLVGLGLLRWDGTELVIADGVTEGPLLGSLEGKFEGFEVGVDDGLVERTKLGLLEGSREGRLETLGRNLGPEDGDPLGRNDGVDGGSTLGVELGMDEDE